MNKDLLNFCFFVYGKGPDKEAPQFRILSHTWDQKLRTKYVENDCIFVWNSKKYPSHFKQ